MICTTSDYVAQQKKAPRGRAEARWGAKIGGSYGGLGHLKRRLFGRLFGISQSSNKKAFAFVLGHHHVRRLSKTRPFGVATHFFPFSKSSLHNTLHFFWDRLLHRNTPKRTHPDFCFPLPWRKRLSGKPEVLPSPGLEKQKTGG